MIHDMFAIVFCEDSNSHENHKNFVPRKLLPIQYLGNIVHSSTHIGIHALR